MAKSLPQQNTQTFRGRRFSLRTLFFISIAIAVPFLLLANLRHSMRPEESVASPLYLMLGIAGVVFAAAIGSAVGSRTVMFVAACVAALSWIAIVLLCGIFSKELMAVLPAHAIVAAATLAVLAVAMRSAKRSEVEGPHDMLLKLLKVKHDVQESQQAKHPEIPAETSIQNPNSKTQN